MQKGPSLSDRIYVKDALHLDQPLAQDYGSGVRQVLRIGYILYFLFLGVPLTHHNSL